MKYILTISIVLFSVLASAQNQKCGVPTYNPKTNESHFYVDTCGKQVFQYKRPKWYFIGRIISESAPTIESTTSGVTINYSEAEWYKGSTGRFYRCNGTSWVNNDNVNVDSLVNVHFAQTVLGKKTFADTLTALKGINSGGIIDTKGVKSTGDATNAAAILNGVVSEKDTVVATNFTLTGAYGSVGWNCTTGVKDCILPTIGSTVGWIFSIRKEDDTNNILRIKDSNGTVIYTLYSKISVKFQNTGSSWKRKQ